MDHPRISQDQRVRSGRPVIKGTRITVEFVMELLSAGWSVETILHEYPHLRREDIVAAQAYAADKQMVTAAE